MTSFLFRVLLLATLAAGGGALFPALHLVDAAFAMPSSGSSR